jgi:hypothetical protein
MLAGRSSSKGTHEEDSDDLGERRAQAWIDWAEQHDPSVAINVGRHDESDGQPTNGNPREGASSTAPVAHARVRTR